MFDEIVGLTDFEKSQVQDCLMKLMDKYPSIKFVFLSISGSHTYGTKDNTVDTDIDVRGAYLVPTDDILGVSNYPETIEFKDGFVEVSIHEVGKFLKEMLSPNANYLEWIYSPIQLEQSKYYGELRKIADMLLSKELYGHIQGFSINTWRHAEKEHWNKPKRILYLYRDLLRGIILFKEKKFESNVTKLAKMSGNKQAIERIKKLIEFKQKGIDLKNYGIECKENLEELQREMLRLKDFGTLTSKPLLDKAYVNRFIIKLRKENFKEQMNWSDTLFLRQLLT